RNNCPGLNIWAVVTSTVSVFPTPVGPSSRKLPRGREGLVRLSSPRRTTEMIRGRAWDWPRISRGRSESSSWSLASFVESVLVFIPFPLPRTGFAFHYHGQAVHFVYVIHL